MADPPDTADAMTRPFHEVAEALGLGMPYRVLVSAGDLERRFLHVGETCLQLNGVPAEAVLADSSLLYGMILPESRAAFMAAEAAAIGALRGFQVEVQMRRADGELRWHRIASYPRVLPDGSTVWEGLQTDITETRRLADELAEERRRLQLAVEATGLGLWEWDPQGREVLWSERNKALFGLARDAHIDIDRYMALIHPDDLAAVQEAYRLAADGEDGGDFQVEHRVVAPDGQVRWILTHGRVLKEDGEAAVVLGTSLDVTGRRTAEESRALLMGELAHRAKNGLTVMMAVVSQTARSAASVADFEAVLIARLDAMAKSQDLVTATGGGPIALTGVLERVLSPFGLTRFDIAPGIEPVTIAGGMATALGLLLHEMATNAVKYGALSDPQGRVRIVPGEAPAGRVVLQWCEAGGPPAAPPARTGFGSRVLQAALAPFGGKVGVEYRPEGFQARVEFPAAS